MKKIPISILICILFFYGCHNEEWDGTIILPDGVHLEDTKSGSFLKTLNIDYNSGNSFFINLRNSLVNYATLEDEYYEKGDKVFVRRWIVQDYEYGNLIILEKWKDNYLYYEYLLDSGGILFSELIGEASKRLSTNRKYEGAVYINSSTDKARLILFGYGKYCYYIGLIEGARDTTK